MKEKIFSTLEKLLEEYRDFYRSKKINLYEEELMDSDLLDTPEYHNAVDEITSNLKFLTINDIEKIYCYYSICLSDDGQLKVFLNYKIDDYYCDAWNCDNFEFTHEEQHQIEENCEHILKEISNIKMLDYFIIYLYNNETPDETLYRVFTELNDYNLPKKVKKDFLEQKNGTYKTVIEPLSDNYLEQIKLKINLNNF